MAGVDDDIQLIRDLVAWTNSNAKQIADAIGVANTTINRFANGSAQTRLGRATLEKLRAEFPLFPGFVARPASNATPVRFEGASLEVAHESLPIYGTALGAARFIEGEAVEQTTLNQGDVIEYVKRPVILNRKQNCYGLYVQGSSMHPALPDGDMVVAVKGMPLSIGDNVVVYLRSDGDSDDGARARGVLVKELVRRTASYIELRQYSPAMDFRIQTAEVLRVDRILSRREMLAG